MGRQAVATRDAVFEAADRLKIVQKDTDEITVKAVRDVIGGGSHSTVHKHLLVWKATDLAARSSLPKAPQETVALPPTLQQLFTEMRLKIDKLEALVMFELKTQTELKRSDANNVADRNTEQHPTRVKQVEKNKKPVRKKSKPSSQEEKAKLSHINLDEKSDTKHNVTDVPVKQKEEATEITKQDINDNDTDKADNKKQDPDQLSLF